MSIPSIWTNPEATAELCEMIAARKSSGIAAAHLSQKYSRVSRSACIGKAHRMKLRFISEVHDYGARVITIPRKPRRAHVKRERGESLAPLPPLSVTQADHDIPAEQRKQLLELTNETCRYPIGDLNDPGFFFCGALEADLHDRHPYCARHARITTNRQRSYDLSDEERARRRLWANKLNASGFR
jgi:GcrA cell cycle regulator